MGRVQHRHRHNRWRRIAGVGWLLFVLTSGALAQGPEPPGSSADSAAPPLASDERLIEVWDSLAPADRAEIAAWTRAELERLDSFQNRLLRFELKRLEQARYAWSPARDPRVYDPEVHAPAQPIPRRLQQRDGVRHRKQSALLLAHVPERKLDPAFGYDWGTGQVVRLANHEDPERIFSNALAGIPPDVDLVEALILRRLDDGELRELHEAFGHVYSDRSGVAYPGISLYDAWCSGQTIETPDVECLGILHDLFDDWDTYVAPVPEAQHDPLYERLGALVQQARRHRGLRTALARTWLQSDPAMRDGYGPSLLRLHALWDLHASTPEKLAAELPSPDDWESWLEQWSVRVEDDPDLWARGNNRRATLQADAQRVRGALIWVMQQYEVWPPRSEKPPGK